jgi:hypothetical protein
VKLTCGPCKKLINDLWYIHKNFSYRLKYSLCTDQAMGWMSQQFWFDSMQGQDCSCHPSVQTLLLHEWCGHVPWMQRQPGNKADASLPSSSKVKSTFPECKGSQGTKLMPHFHLVPRLRTHWATLPPSHMPSRQAHEQFTFLWSLSKVDFIMSLYGWRIKLPETFPRNSPTLNFTQYCTV